MTAKNHIELFKLHCQPQFDEMKKSQAEILECLNGNGRPGLKTRVDRNTRFIKGVKWFWGIIIGGFITWLVKIKI